MGQNNSKATQRSSRLCSVGDSTLDINLNRDGGSHNLSSEALYKKQQPQQRKPNPQQIKIRTHVPLEDRAQVHIEPHDSEFVEVERYFNRLLRDSRTTIDDILKGHFSEHEISKFIPTNKQPISQWQKDNALQFDALLKGRFKGKLPTLACKLAMYYFGLPVAPIKMMSDQSVAWEDLDELEDIEKVEEDPLQCLDEYTARTYETGAADEEVDRSEFGPQPLGLRGGFMQDSSLDEASATTERDDDDEGALLDLWLKDTEHEDVLGDAVSTSTHLELSIGEANGGHERGCLRPFTMHGRQGKFKFGSTWANCIEAINTLLLDPTSHVREIHIVLDIFDRVATDGGWECKHSIEGMFHSYAHDYDAKELKDDPLRRFVEQYLRVEEVEQHGRVCFVRLASEPRPSAPEPRFTADSGIVSIARLETQHEVYMRIASAPGDSHTPSQYREEFQRALCNLFPDDCHHFIELWDVQGVQSFGKMYAFHDPPAPFISAIANLAAAGSELRFSGMSETISTSVVPILIPGLAPCGVYNTGTSGEAVVMSIRQQSIFGAAALIRQAWNACVGTAATGGQEIKSFHVWLPAEKFMRAECAPCVIDVQGDSLTQRGLGRWISAINESRLNDPSAWERGVSVVVQPVYRKYSLTTVDCGGHGSDINQFVAEDLTSWDIDLFRDIVAGHLYPQLYNPADKKHVLRINGQCFTTELVVGFDTTNFTWNDIKRRITTDVLNIVLDTSNNEPFEIKQSNWGPCYNPPEISRPTQPTTVNSSTNSGSGSSAELGMNPWSCRPDEVSDTAMRHQTYWDSPSVFANPLQPVVPVHAAPVERMLRTGPAVPSVSLAVRTPTEMARLEREVHALRGELLDRARACPYAGCGRSFHYRDAAGLQHHLTREHATLKCLFCHVLGRSGAGGGWSSGMSSSRGGDGSEHGGRASVAFGHENMLLLDNEEALLEHFYTNHWDQFSQLGELMGALRLTSPDQPNQTGENRAPVLESHGNVARASDCSRTRGLGRREPAVADNARQMSHYVTPPDSENGACVNKHSPSGTTRCGTCDSHKKSMISCEPVKCKTAGRPSQTHAEVSRSREPGPLEIENTISTCLSDNYGSSSL
ncbi:hypothetical protein BX600DRAFT_552665 [Xylariales sp. PMI_506]|nr:hypothetical protein BX600DRAFT_552665 [Xylariales sp. PMI_506]